MHSFAITLIATSLARFASAAPLNLDASSSLGGISSTLHPITSGALSTRDDIPSVCTIFGDLTNTIQFATSKLSSISSNVTVKEVTDIVASIEGPILDVAVPKLKALAGLDVSVILAGPVGIETVADVAAIVGAEVTSILCATGDALAAIQVDVKINADVKAILEDLGAAVTVLVENVVAVVDGLDVALAAQVEPVVNVFAELDLGALAQLIGINE